MAEKTEWGLADGQQCFLITLKNSGGMTATLTNYGAAVVGLTALDRNGNFADVILGYDGLDGYINGTAFHGAVVGRFANRLGGAKFGLHGKTYDLFKNDGDNCLHGGRASYGKRVWETLEVADNSVLFGYISPDGEEGFPATVRITVEYALTEDNSLFINYRAKSDGDTILNLTNHSYFNLAPESGDILGTELQIFSGKYTPFTAGLIPTGEIADVKGTPLDFTLSKQIGADIDAIGGYDHNYILGEPGVMRKCAKAYHENSGRVMTVFTDCPAMQFYTGNHLSEIGKGGAAYGRYAGFCLETQFTPNTPNLPAEMGLPSCTLKKGEDYNFTTEYEFSVKDR